MRLLQPLWLIQQIFMSTMALAHNLWVYNIVEDPKEWWSKIKQRWLGKRISTRGPLFKYARMCADAQFVHLPPRPVSRLVMMLKEDIPTDQQRRLKSVMAKIEAVKAKVQDKGKGKGKTKN